MKKDSRMANDNPREDLSALIYVVIMKVGYHTDETLNDIIKRKRMEDAQGALFWGYGGTVCHPTKQVLPFVEKAKSSEQSVHLLMAFTPSKYRAQPIVSTHYSSNGVVWHPVPDYAHITGSRYALVCRKLNSVEAEIDLNNYVVGVGPKVGVRATDYLRRRVDKACAIYDPLDDAEPGKIIKIQYVVELVEPYAVFLRTGKEQEIDRQQLRLLD